MADCLRNIYRYTMVIKFIRKNLGLSIILATANIYVHSSGLIAEDLICNKKDLPFHCMLSEPIKFNIILDENITFDDPRIKAIFYSNFTNPESLIKLAYSNRNAQILCQKIFDILLQHQARVSKPLFIAPSKLEEDAMKYAYLWMLYPETGPKSGTSGKN